MCVKSRSLAVVAMAGMMVLSYSCRKDGTSIQNCPEQNLTQRATVKEKENHYVVKMKNLPSELTSGLPVDYSSRTKMFDGRMGEFLRSRINAALNPTAVFSGIFYGFEAVLTDEQRNLLALSPFVDQIEKVRSVTMVQSCNSKPFEMSSQKASSGMLRVGTGNGVGKRVWILDTGVDGNHPDLTVNAMMSRDFTGGTIGGVAGTSATEDLQGHGTHVAGIVAAKNNNIGVIGVAAGAQICALKVLDSTGAGNSTILIQALDYLFLTGLPGEVVNMSLGGEPSSMVDLAVQQVAAKGLLVAIAAGNDGDFASDYSPARANGTNIFTVSAIGEGDVFASYSNFGSPPVDYAEPGNNILSTYPGGKYGFLSGTSMATPHMAGILLLRGKNFRTEGTAKSDPDGSPDPIAVAR